MEQHVSSHQIDALRLLREGDFASALISNARDSLANASGNGTGGNQSLNSMSPSAEGSFMSKVLQQF
ncbi:CBK_G0011250.mRNA.1.CDS.1 [Saccharomyces cerevisiae]|nr:CBK_G0011250.mRNA.1.CDS.1 [Saccharomyces cerevisiae]CAI7213613.1 CBK_G0011250.mRNA.1.CDS.1 [Saccharomyces cerevisiae]